MLIKNTLSQLKLCGLTDLACLVQCSPLVVRWWNYHHCHGKCQLPTFMLLCSFVGQHSPLSLNMSPSTKLSVLWHPSLHPSGSRVPWILLTCVGGNKCPGWEGLPQTQLERPAGKRGPHFTPKPYESKEWFVGKRRFCLISFVPLCAFKDANWIALNSSLQCRSLSDIFLLFKSSDFITHDLTQP